MLGNGFVSTGVTTESDGFAFSDNGTAAAGGLVSGIWNNTFSIDVDSASVATVVLDNTLTSAALTATDSAIINKAGVSVTVVTEAVTVPEPSSLGLVVMTTAGLVIRCKRRS